MCFGYFTHKVTSAFFVSVENQVTQQQAESHERSSVGATRGSSTSTKVRLCPALIALAITIAPQLIKPKKSESEQEQEAREPSKLALGVDGGFTGFDGAANPDKLVVVHTFAHAHKPGQGIFDVSLARLLHRRFSDKEDQHVFEQLLRLKPLAQPVWMRRSTHKAVKAPQPQTQKSGSRVSNSNSNFKKAPRARKRPFSEMSSSDVIQEPDVIAEPQVLMSSDPLISEPTLIGQSEPPAKRARVSSESLLCVHPYLRAVSGAELSGLRAIALQLSRGSSQLLGLSRAAVTVSFASLGSLSAQYRISWLGRGFRLWLMLLGKKGVFLVEPAADGGILAVAGTRFEKSGTLVDGTLCCGELVVDHLGERRVPRLLVTDLLVLESQSLCKFPHTERLRRAQNALCRACAQSLQTSKLRIRVKPMYAIKGEGADIVSKLQRMVEQELPHKCDGLGLFPIKPPFGQRLLRIAL